MLLLYEDDYFFIEQSHECFIPGYLICTAKEKAPSLADLSQQAQQQLGPLLSKATQAIHTALSPERVYCMSFGELFYQVHFHLFPRTAWLAEAYKKAHPTQTDYINGPLIFNWAKTNFTKPLSQFPLQPTLTTIQSYLQTT